MTFALYELAINLDIQEELRNDIKKVLSRHDNKLTYESMLDMKYLQMVIDGDFLEFVCFEVLLIFLLFCFRNFKKISASRQFASNCVK